MRAWLFLFASLMVANARAETAYFMDLEGTVSIDTEGHVVATSLNGAAQQPIVDLVANAAKRWRFEPYVWKETVVPVRSSMSITLRGDRREDGSMSVKIDEVAFGLANGEARETSEAARHSVSLKRVPAPEYPLALYKARVSGRTWISIRVDETGRIAESAVYETHLHGVEGEEEHLANFRKHLEHSAMEVLPQWRISIPENDKRYADRTFIVPFYYRIPRESWPGKGEWYVLNLGPRRRAPWLADDRLAVRMSVDPLNLDVPKLLTGPNGEAI